jgi:putative exosortase-associated protein (TIGR04073 family)
MRKQLLGLFVAAIFLLFSTTSHAASDELFSGMGEKLWRGIVNTFTGWIEFPAQIIKGYDEGFLGDEDNKIVGALAGIFDGIGHSAGRTLYGVADIVGFWAASPEDNEGVGISLDAEYAWEEGSPYDLFDPDFGEATIRPIGQKLFRGLSNGLLGFVELPGQILKGVSEGAPDLGIFKGLWYWYSREVAGLTDIGTIILPNPPDTKGLAFDEEYPWDAFVDAVEQ